MIIQTTKGALVEIDPGALTLVKFMGDCWAIEANKRTYHVNDETFMQLMGVKENETNNISDDIWADNDTRRLRKLV
jgi:hypothetical protein